MKLLGNLMIIIYLTFGIFLLFTPLFAEYLLPRYRIIIGISCIIYAFFRAYRAYTNFKESNENEYE